MTEATNKPPRRDERRRARDQKRWPTKQKAHHPGKMAGFKMNSQEQSTEANSKAKPMVAPGLACHNHRKPKGPVCRNTFDNAFATHDETVGFVAPKFHYRLNFQAMYQSRNSCFGVVLGKMGHSVRLAAWRYPCYEHLAHPLYVVMQRVVPESHNGAKTMQMATTLRPSAHPAHHGHTFPTHRETTAHASGFNRDVIAIANIENALQLVHDALKGILDIGNGDHIAIANIENALQRVMYELKKASPDMERAKKLTLAAMAAVQYVGCEVLQ